MKGNKYIRAFFDKQFLKFCAVGVANTVVGTAVMYGLYNIGHFDYWFSSAMNYVVGSVLSYFLNKRFTFKSTSKSWREVLRFIVNIAACYFVAYTLARPLVQAIFDGLSDTARDNIAMLGGMVIFTCLNYLGQRFFAFKYTTSEEQDAVTQQYEEYHAERRRLADEKEARIKARRAERREERRTEREAKREAKKNGVPYVKPSEREKDENGEKALDSTDET